MTYKYPDPISLLFVVILIVGLFAYHELSGQDCMKYGSTRGAHERCLVWTTNDKIVGQP